MRHAGMLSITGTLHWKGSTAEHNNLHRVTDQSHIITDYHKHIMERMEEFLNIMLCKKVFECLKLYNREWDRDGEKMPICRYYPSMCLQISGQTSPKCKSTVLL